MTETDATAPPLRMSPAPSPPATHTPTGPAALVRERGEATLAEQLAARCEREIREQRRPPGSRLPSVRASARQHGVSPHTVVAAYDLLQAQGLVEARRQRGFFVREQASRASGPRNAPAAPELPIPADAGTLIRGMLGDASRPVQGPGLGTLPPDWLDAELLHKALRRVLASAAEAASIRYGEPAGDARLRQALVKRLEDVGVRAAAHQVITTAGATHALDLLCRTVLRPGDAVLLDEPGWAIDHARLARLGVRLLAVPRGPEGPDLARLEALAASHHPRLYITVSVLHNPTGQNLALGTAHRLLRLAEAHGFLIVEDDTYAYLAPAHTPRLAALDGLQHTVYVSGFAKILAPGWRIGYMAAPAALCERLVDTKMLGSLTTPAVLEQAMAVCLEQGGLRRHAERVMAQLDAARQRTVRLALQAGCRFVTPPQGLFGWVETGVDTDALALALAAQGWLLAPGSLFLPDKRRCTLMRLNFATSQDKRFWDAYAAQCRLMGQGADPAGTNEKAAQSAA